MSILDKFGSQEPDQEVEPKSILESKERVLEDGRTSLRSIRQYLNLSEIYRAFGEILPHGEKGNIDFQNRAEAFVEERKKES